MCIDDFFPDVEEFKSLVKDEPLYTPREFDALQNNTSSDSKDQSHYVGVRSSFLHSTNKKAFDYIIDVFENKLGFFTGNLKYIDTHIHLRPYDSIDNPDWIHKDDYKGDDYTLLVYLSDTNLNSGTGLFDDNNNLITDFKFIKNRAIIFDTSYNHKSKLNYGDSIDDGRLTLNCFIRLLDE